MSRLRTRRRRELAVATATLVLVMALAGALGQDAVADTAGTPDPIARAKVGTGADPAPDIMPPGALTGLSQGSNVRVHAEGNGDRLFGVTARLCKSGLSITQTAQFNPTQFGVCIPAPFVAGSDDEYVQVVPSDPFTPVDLDFRVGTGTQTFNLDDGSTSTVTCDATSPCALWLDLEVPISTRATGHVWKHYELFYGSSTSSSTNPPSSTSSTTPVASTTSTPVSSSTTVPTSTTSSTARSGASTTTTTTTIAMGDVTVSPTTVAPGGTFTVTSPAWKPDAEVTAVLRSDPVTLGTLVADGAGVVSGSLSVPPTTPVGSHSIELSGIGADGSNRLVIAPLAVSDESSGTGAAGTAETAGTDGSLSGSSSQPSGGSALARTGIRVLALLTVASALLGAGMLLAAAARRRLGHR